MPKAPKLASKHMLCARRALPGTSLQRLAGAALLGFALLGAPVTQAVAATSANQAAITEGQNPVAAPQGAAFELALSNPGWTYQEAKFFKRISEFFTGEENSGYRLIRRTDPQQRAGLYFQARLSRPAAQLPDGSTAVLAIVLPDSQSTVVYHFSLPHSGEDADKTQLWLGLTGENTPKDEAAPLAWQLRIEAPSGQTLAETHSFLWSTRDAPTEAQAQ